MLWRGRNALTFGRGTPCSLAIIFPCGDERGIDQLESYDFGAERKRLKSPDRCLFNRAERVMNGCLLWLS